MSDPRPPDALAELCRQAVLLCRTGSGALVRLRITHGDMSVDMRWARSGAPPPEEGGAEPPQDGSREVCAPLVGTLYLAPEPGAEPFVRVGDTVAAGQQIAIIEAMKLMNAVTADLAGTVTEILLPDATPVEYGQPIIALVPA